MSFTITCPSCKLQGDAPDSLKVEEVKCPRCGSGVPVRRRERAVSPIPVGASNADSCIQAIDQFFVDTASPPRASRRSAIRSTPPPRPVEEDTVYEIAANPEEKAAEQQWSREERARIEAYAANQLAQIKQQREELAAWRSQVEAALVAREQEVNRQLKLIAVRNDKLQNREAECTAREADLAIDLEKSGQMLTARESARRQQQEAEAAVVAQTEVLAQLTARVAEAEEALRKAEMERTRVVDDMADYNRARDDEEREWNVRRHELERRVEKLEQSEQAMARQVMEAAEVESLVRAELEQRESELAILSRELDLRHNELLTCESAELRNLRARVRFLSGKLEEERRKNLARDNAELRNLRSKIVSLSRHLETLRRPAARKA
jgi:hypothetical protein